MPKEDKSLVARLTIKGEHFEILVDPDLAWELKSGKDVDFESLLVSETVFKDSRKALKASDESVKKNFGTDDIKAIATTIIRKGELQLTTEQRREMVENKRKQIIAFIVKNCIDPKSGLPHPPQRIENALEHVRLNIDPFKTVEEQAQEAIKLLRVDLPLKISQVVLTISVSKEYASRVSSAVSKYGSVTRSEWKHDGSWFGEIVLPAGMQQTFVDRVNDMTRGSAEINIAKKI